jgi:hypothetical protein
MLCTDAKGHSFQITSSNRGRKIRVACTHPGQCTNCQASPLCRQTEAKKETGPRLLRPGIDFADPKALVSTGQGAFRHDYYPEEF